MIMRRYSIKLNLDVPIFNPDFDVNTLKQTEHVHMDTNCFSDELKEIAESRGMWISFAESFYRESYGSTRNAHRDAPRSKSLDVCKLNFVIGGEDTYMDWYMPKPNTSEKTGYTPIGFPFQYYDYDDLEKVHSEILSGPCLVNVGLYHGITSGKMPRHCVSMFIKYKTNNDNLDMDEMAEIFSEYIR